ncbi:MAG: hypothetical protein HQL56_10640 [Magnetococcales bacterium]|nr:hypothetical protein [Magnetococcales bacterium]
MRPVPESPPPASAEETVRCRPPSVQTEAAINQYMACQWRQRCLDQLASLKRMAEDGMAKCPKTGANARPCMNYHQSLQERYQPGMCDRMAPSNFYPRAPFWP